MNTWHRRRAKGTDFSESLVIIMGLSKRERCNRTSEGRSHSHEPLQVMRQRAVKAIRAGQGLNSLAPDHRINVRSVFRWLADVADRGQNPLRAKSISGRPSRASEKQMCWQAQAVKDNVALPFKFAYGLWTLSLIGPQFEQRFGKITNVEMLSDSLGWKHQTASSICSGL